MQKVTSGVGGTVSRACPCADITAGRELIVETGDHGDLADCVVIAGYR